MNDWTNSARRVRRHEASGTQAVLDVSGTCCHQRDGGFSPKFGAAWGACVALGMQVLLVTGDHISAVRDYLLKYLPAGEGRVVLASLMGHEIHVIDGGHEQRVHHGKPVQQSVRRNVFSCYERAIRSVASGDFSFSSDERTALESTGGTRFEIGGRMGLKTRCLCEGREMKQTVYFPDHPVATGTAAAVLNAITDDSELEGLCSEFDLQLIVSSNFADTVPFGLNKWKAVERATRLGLADLSRFVLIAGDGRNDYDLLINRELPSTKGVVKAYVGSDGGFWHELNGPADADLFWLEGTFVDGTTHMLEQLLVCD